MYVIALVWCVIQISPILHHSYFNYFMFDFKCNKITHTTFLFQMENEILIFPS